MWQADWGDRIFATNPTASDMRATIADCLHLLARVAVSLVAIATLGCAVAPKTEEAGMANDQVEIRATLDALNDACAKRDIHAFMGLFEENDQILLVGSDTGEVYHGRKEISGFMEMLFNLPFVFSFDLKNLTLRQDRNSAWLFTDGNMIHTGDKGESAGTVAAKPYRFSVTLVKRDEVWKWQLFHGSVPGAE